MDEKIYEHRRKRQVREMWTVVRAIQELEQEAGRPVPSARELFASWRINPDAAELYHPVQAGVTLGVTKKVAEHIANNACGRRARVHTLKDGSLKLVPAEQPLREIRPVDGTDEEIAAWLKKLRRERRSEYERRRRKLKRHMAAQIADLDCRPSAILDALVPRKWTTIPKLTKTLEKSRCRAFEGLTGRALETAVRREVNKIEAIERREVPAKLKHANTMILEICRV